IRGSGGETIGISALFLATESHGRFRSPAWLKVRGARTGGRCPSGDFGSGYAGLVNMRVNAVLLLQVM
ncbi:MAG TPA: hypothetical protein PLW35_13695, partial [Verrucomicrobiota bacterium]|nr:hypothetical protein [Verrucomicrobiota bacterium]